MMKNYTKSQMDAIQDFLTVCIKNNYHCEHCARNHEGICFFAFQYFMNDMNYFDDGDDDDNYIPDDVDESNYDPYCGCDMFEICGSIDEEW